MTPVRFAVDWNYWLDSEFWSVRDAVCLSLDLEPRHVDVQQAIQAYRPFTRYKGRVTEPLKDRLQQVADTFTMIHGPTGSMFLGNPWEDKIRPSEFVHWTRQLRWTVPAHFDLIVDFGQPGLSDAVATNEDDAAVRRSAATKERQTLLKLIIGMAVGGYCYNPAERSSAPGDIAKDVQELGLDIDDDTVRKWLRLAADIYLVSKPKA